MTTVATLELQFKVAGFVAAGLSNKEIAAELEISVYTVSNHIAQELARAGVDNRTKLAYLVLHRL